MRQKTSVDLPLLLIIMVLAAGQSFTMTVCCGYEQTHVLIQGMIMVVVSLLLTVSRLPVGIDGLPRPIKLHALISPSTLLRSHDMAGPSMII